MAALSWSASPDIPIMRSARSAFSRPEGSGMVYFGLFRKPLGAPSWAMALSMPWEMAAFMPPAASFDDTASIEPAAAVAAVSDHDGSQQPSGRTRQSGRPRTCGERRVANCAQLTRWRELGLADGPGCMRGIGA